MITIYLVVGFFASILMYTGDMLLYGTKAKIPTSLKNDFDKIQFLLRQSTSRRIFWGGIIGPFASTLYLFSFLHIPALALPQCQIIAWLLFGLFALSFAFGGAYHMAWLFLGDAASLNSEKQWRSICNRFSQLKPFVFGLMLFSSLLFSCFILFGFLIISPWYTFITPMALVLLLPILRKIPQPIGIWIWGGWFNLVFAIYYAGLLLTIMLT